VLWILGKTFAFAFAIAVRGLSRLVEYMGEGQGKLLKKGVVFHTVETREVFNRVFNSFCTAFFNGLSTDAPPLFEHLNDACQVRVFGK